MEPKRKTKAPARAGSIDLVFGFDQYVALAVTGFCGMLPLTGWMVTLLMPVMDAEHGRRLGGSALLDEIAGPAFAFALLVAPSLIPPLVLRARQPRGARIAWDDEGVVEWDGPWRRAAIPWDRLVATHFVWQRPVGKWTMTKPVSALLLQDRATGAVIHVWEERPKGAPLVRRRLRSEGVGALRDAIEARKIALDGPAALDWARAADPDRTRRTWVLVVGRLGYFATLATVLVVPAGSGVGLPVAIAGAALLAVRAAPAVRELVAIVRRLARGGAASGPPDAARAYREPERVPIETDESGRAAADRLRLRAVAVEALVRCSFVVLAIASAR